MAGPSSKKQAVKYSPKTQPVAGPVKQMIVKSSSSTQPVAGPSHTTRSTENNHSNENVPRSRLTKENSVSVIKTKIQIISLTTQPVIN